VEDNRVSDRQFVSRDNNFAGVTNNWIKCLTPALVADDPLTVFTSCLDVVPVAVIQGCFVVRHSLILLGPCLSARKINRTRHLLELGRLLSRRAELYDLSAVQRRGTLQRFPKVLRYIKLNYLCHDHLLLYEPLSAGLGCNSAFRLPMALPNPSALTTHGLAQLELVQECFANGA